MRIDKTRVLAAERQDPMTAAEHAELHGHQAEHSRDVPRTCHCPWQWSPADARYVLVGLLDGCPWHTTPTEGDHVDRADD